MRSLTRHGLVAFLVTALALVSFGAYASTASALDPCLGPTPPDSCFETHTETANHTLSVSMTSVFWVNSSPAGINACWSSCSAVFQSTRECDFYVCGEWSHTTVDLTPIGSHLGYQYIWAGGCESITPQCSVVMSADRAVTVTRNDVMPPSLSFPQPAKVGPNTPILANASDNSGQMPTYAWKVDGAVQVSTDSDITIGGFSEGPHSIEVTAKDSSGNISSPVTRTVQLDKSTGVTVGSIAAFVNAIPTLNFTPPADVASVQCALWSTGGAPAPTTCNSGIAAAPPDSVDGLYHYKVVVVDDVNNSATVAGDFTLDRTAPALSIISGPAEGSSISAGDATFGFSVSEVNLATVSCQVDSGAAGACSGAAIANLASLPAGAHQLTLVATDKAGNTTTIVRHFSVAARAAANPATIAAPLAANPATIAALWKVRSGKTGVRSLAASKLPAGSSVTVSCKGKGCPFKSKNVKVVGGKADLAKLFKRKSLKAGVKLTIVIAAPGYETLTATFTTRKRATPKQKTATS